MQFRPPRFDKPGRFGGHSYNLWPAFKANRALLTFTLEGLLYTTQSIPQRYVQKNGNSLLPYPKYWVSQNIALGYIYIGLSYEAGYSASYGLNPQVACGAYVERSGRCMSSPVGKSEYLFISTTTTDCLTPAGSPSTPNSVALI